jgi:translocation and assembly module TamB
MASEAPRPPRTSRLRPALLWALALAAVLALPPAALWLLMRSEGGTTWLLTRVPGLQVEGVHGALLADRLAIERLRWQGTAGALDLEQLQIDAPQWRLWPAPGQWIGLRTQRIAVARLGWRSGAGGGPPPALPTDLRLPLQLATPVSVQALEIDTLPPVRDLSFTLHLGDEDGHAHRLQDLGLRWDRLRASAGRVRIATAAPLALEASLDLAAADGAPLPWQAQARAGGTLERIELAGTLRGGGAAGDTAALDLEAQLQPFAAWPLGALAARTEGLDLATLASTWPATRLRGELRVLSSGREQPIEADLQLVNDAPGRWDQGRIPVSQAELQLRGRLSTPDAVDVNRIDLRLADATAAAGRWQGSGRWQANRLDLDTTLEGVAPRRLDARAAAMTLGGPLSIGVTGLPSPDPRAEARPQAPELTLRTRLQGRIEGAPLPVTADLQLQASADRLQVSTLTLQAGEARATAKGTATRSGRGWSVQSAGELVDFDPVPWWPGPEGSAWQRGPHRLNATWTADIATPAPTATATLPQLLQQLRGQARLQVERSQLAGVPLAATLDLDQTAGARLDAQLELGGNHVTLQGQVNPAGDGRADRWALDLQAPALAALAPLAQLHPALATWAPSAGRASAQVQAQGRWPALTTEGEATFDTLRSTALELASARLRWQAGSQADAPLSGRLDLSGLAYGEVRVPALQAELDGSLSAHRLQAVAALPVRPPAALAQSLGLVSQPGTRAALRGEGAWASAAEGGGRWMARLAALQVAGWDGRLPLGPAAAGTGADWLDARDLRVELNLGAGGHLQRGRIDAGRATLAGGIGLRWDEIVYDGTAGGQLQLRAEVERFLVAPLLARWQPAMGWEGDLVVGASVNLRAAERFDADILVERVGGDLQVRDAAANPMALGLTDLRIALNAHDGTWFFTQALAGRTLGEMGAVLRLRTDPAERWPAAAAPLDGSVSARVADLGVWGAWVPAGWRLQGNLATTAVFGGTFGAPEVRGRLDGSGLGVRNLLEGVHVRDGEVALRLEGEVATVDRFFLRAGDGTLTLRGGAVLGADPSARLSVTAEQFQLLGRIDRRLVASGQAALLLDPELLRLDGRFAVDEGLFDASRADTPSLDDDVIVRRPGADEPPRAAAAQAGPRRKVDVTLDIDLGKRLRVRGRGLDTLLAGQLRMTAPGGRLAVNGTVETVGGTYAAYGQKLEITRGRVAFGGAPDNPRLDILALRPKLDVEVGVAITGPVQSPRVRLHSVPDMSDTDKLSWLVLGREPDALGRADTALLQRAALALLSGEGEGPTDSLIGSLGLDELSVRQSDGEVRETIVTVGKQLSDRWYVGYERGVNATTGTFQLIYRVAQRITLRLRSGLEDALDAIWTWRVP